MLQQQHLLLRMGYSDITQKEPVPNLSLPVAPKYHILSKPLINLIRSCFDQTYNKEDAINPNPFFQRQYVWDEEKKQALILSILSEQSIGNFYVNQFTSLEAIEEIGEGYGSLVWDGKQRAHSVFDFLQDLFAVKLNGNYYYYSEIVPYFNRALDNVVVSIHQSYYNTAEEIVRDYLSINKHQVKHSDADLEYAASFLQKHKKTDK